MDAIAKAVSAARDAFLWRCSLRHVLATRRAAAGECPTADCRCPWAAARHANGEHAWTVRQQIWSGSAKQVYQCGFCAAWGYRSFERTAPSMVVIYVDNSRATRIFAGYLETPRHVGLHFAVENGTRAFDPYIALSWRDAQ